MMTKDRLDTLKFIGGTFIVLTGLSLMLPGLVGYAFSLARLGMIITGAFVLSIMAAIVLQMIRKTGKSK